MNQWSCCILLLIFTTAFFKCGAKLEDRFIFYDVNPGEGFNLRRDVFMRMAIFVKTLNLERKFNYTLVLPPWGRLYHWQSRELGYQIQIPWKSFFDLESICRFVPVIDLEEYLEKKDFVIDSILYLQNYKEGWKDGKFEEKLEFRECNEAPRYRLEEISNLYKGWFWEYDDIRAGNFQCLSVQGSTNVIKDLILRMKAKSIFLERAETLLHDHFGNEDYWGIRRSMRFAQPLIQVANNFRTKVLNSDDMSDKTVTTAKWEDFQPERGRAKGGQYICVHLRRKDFVAARKDQIPTIESAADQIRKKLDSHNLDTVFVSTDSPRNEVEHLKELLSGFRVVKYDPSREELFKFKDGGIAIIDQIICSHAKHFIGSSESTFTFRIQEEREILGFAIENTFDILCPSGKFDCEKGSIWKIVYPKKNTHHEL